jgi:hypothetical protein
LLRRVPDGLNWEHVYEASRPLLASIDKYEVWFDESVMIYVSYGNDKAVLKGMGIRMPLWKAEARRLLIRLRGLVGL